MITPSTNVFLLKSPLEMNDNNQLDFASKQKQFEYFNGLPKLFDDRFTYQRKDGVIRWNDCIDNIIGFNYVMYQNENYGNKWFYAFIENMEYINDSMTAIKIRTDTFQTWQFDLKYKPTFIEREHVNDDTIGKHTIPENLEIGEYIIHDSFDVDYVGHDFGSGYDTAPYIAIGVTELPTKNITPSMATETHLSEVKIQNRIPSGLTYLITNNYSEQISRIISLYAYNSKSDAIQTIFPVPYDYIENTTINFNTYQIFGTAVQIGILGETNAPVTLRNVSSIKPTGLASYKPRNNKLLTFPYCYELVSNNAGTDVIYRWEDFDGNAQFKVIGAITPNMSIKCYPTNYLNGSNKEAYNHGITGAKLPTASWNSDYYISWLNQQGQNFAIQSQIAVAKGGLQIAGSAMTANLLGGASSALDVASTISNIMQTQRDAELVPQQARGNINSGDINFSANKSGFTFTDMCIKPEYSKQIDSYFDMFGYKVNIVKKPNVKGRSNWNYVKTIDCYIDGDIPQSDLTDIKNNFNTGITIWHHPETFMDYGQNNAII